LDLAARITVSVVSPGGKEQQVEKGESGSRKHDGSGYPAVDALLIDLPCGSLSLSRRRRDVRADKTDRRPVLAAWRVGGHDRSAIRKCGLDAGARLKVGVGAVGRFIMQILDAGMMPTFDE
jgi:hypothetical protein